MATLPLVGCARPSGYRPYVRSLSLRGVHNVDRRELARGLAVYPGAWWQVARSRLFDELFLDADRLRVKRYYEAHGYFASEVTLAEGRPRADHRAMDVVIAVDEGPPTQIGDVRVYGLGDVDHALKKQTDQEQFAIRRGQIFLHADYLRFKEAILGILKSHGHAWAHAEGKVVIDPVHNVANVEIVFHPGAIATIGRIVILGAGSAIEPPPEGPTPKETLRLRHSVDAARRIDPRLLEAVFGARTGSRFDLSELEAGRGRILELGIFSSVGLAYAPSAEHPDQVDVTLRLADASLHEFRVGGGIGIEAQRNEVRVSLQYTRRNFFGGLRTLDFRLQPAYVVVPAVWSPIVRHGPAATAELIFTQPRLGALSRLQLSVGYDLGVEYAYQYYGPRAQLAVLKLLWHDRIAVALSYNFQYLSFFATTPELLADPSRAGIRYGYVDPYRLSWVQEEVRLDWRDSRVDPRRGLFAELVLEQGGVYTGSAFSYQKLRMGQRGYVPLGTRVVLANRVEFAQMWSQGDNSSPITRRLSLGGAGSHRGFTEGRLAPQIAVANGSPLPIGGEQSLLISGEVRVDLFRLLGSLLAAAAFMDIGDVGAARGDDVSGQPRHISYRNPHVAVGAGLRYRTPIGVLRTDVGVRLNRLGATEADGTPNPDPGQRVAFHISLSEAF